MPPNGLNMVLVDLLLRHAVPAPLQQNGQNTFNSRLLEAIARHDPDDTHQ